MEANVDPSSRATFTSLMPSHSQSQLSHGEAFDTVEHSRPGQNNVLTQQHHGSDFHFLSQYQQLPQHSLDIQQQTLASTQPEYTTDQLSNFFVADNEPLRSGGFSVSYSPQSLPQASVQPPQQPDFDEQAELSYQDLLPRPADSQQLPLHLPQQQDSLPDLIVQTDILGQQGSTSVPESRTQNASGAQNSAQYPSNLAGPQDRPDFSQAGAVSAELPEATIGRENASAQQMPITMPDPASDPDAMTGKKRGRPKGSRNRKTLERQGLLPPAIANVAARAYQSEGVPLHPPLKKRGRPLGSKNRKTLEKELELQRQQQTQEMSAALPGALGSAPLPSSSRDAANGAMFLQPQESLNGMLTGQAGSQRSGEGANDAAAASTSGENRAQREASNELLEKFGPELLARYPELIGKFKVPGRKPGRPLGSKTVHRRTKEEREAKAQARLLPSGKRRGRPPGSKNKSSASAPAAANGHLPGQVGPSGISPAHPMNATSGPPPEPASSMLPRPTGQQPQSALVEGAPGVAIGFPAPTVEGQVVEDDPQQGGEVQATEDRDQGQEEPPLEEATIDTCPGASASEALTDQHQTATNEQRFSEATGGASDGVERVAQTTQQGARTIDTEFGNCQQTNVNSETHEKSPHLDNEHREQML